MTPQVSIKTVTFIMELKSSHQFSNVVYRLGKKQYGTVSYAMWLRISKIL